MVCDQCQQIADRLQEDRLFTGNKFYLHKDAQSLLSSVDGGCPICVQLFGIFTSSGWQFDGEPKSLAATQKIQVECGSTWFTKSKTYPRFCMWLEFKLKTPSEQKGTEDADRPNSTTFMLSTTLNHKPPSKCFAPGAPNTTASTDTGSKEVADLLAWWVQQCSKNHKCGRRWKAGQAFVPPRLLQVDGELYRLIDTDMGIEYARLPKTFQDAVVVARRLGIRYLWVDSLCMIQAGLGHVQDWQRHVPLMGTIYEHCFLNIAAADAPDADGGLFHPRAPKMLDKPTVQLQYSGEPTTFEFANRDIQGRVGPRPLNQRAAWEFQERLVAPRTAHFGRHQVSWECRHVSAASECFPRGIPAFYRSGPDTEDPACGKHTASLSLRILCGS